MDKPLIFFVDDEPNILNGLKRFCRTQRRVWDMQFYEGGQQALDALSETRPDVVVSDMRMPGVNGADLFEQISLHWPGVIRIMLSGEAEPEQTMRTVGRSHRFLAKPCNPKALIEAIDAPLRMRDALLPGEVSRESSHFDHLRTPPSIFDQLKEMLAKDEATEQHLTELIMTDPALSARLLQLANSAYFGRSVSTCSISKAIEVIGYKRLAALIERKRIGNNAGMVPNQRQNHIAQAAFEFADGCRATCRARKVSQDLEDLVFAAALFLNLGITEQEEKAQSPSQSSALPAYMTTLLGLPSSLSEVLLRYFEISPSINDSLAKQEALISIVLQSTHKAA